MVLIPSGPGRGMGLGWLPDDDDSRDLDIDTLGISALDLPKETRNARRIPYVLDQGSSKSCVAHAFSMGIVYAETFAGLMPELPSRLWMYFWSRFLHGSHAEDGGTYLRVMAKSLNRWGAPNEDDWPFSQRTSKINAFPSQGVGNSHARRGAKFVRILERGAGRLKAIQAVLAEGKHLIAFGTQVPRDFLSLTGPTEIQEPVWGSVNVVGGHAMLLVDYRYDEDGRLWFLVLNSWGGRWRNGGYAWLAANWIEDHRSNDFQIIHGWRRLGEAG